MCCLHFKEQFFTPRTRKYLPQKPFMEKDAIHMYIVSVTTVTRKRHQCVCFIHKMRGQLWTPQGCRCYNRCEPRRPGSENYNLFLLIRPELWMEGNKPLSEQLSTFRFQNQVSVVTTAASLSWWTLGVCFCRFKPSFCASQGWFAVCYV